MIKDINIQMVGTSQDVKLLKKIFEFYYYQNAKATKTEKMCIKTYIGLIDNAVERTNKKEINL